MCASAQYDRTSGRSGSIVVVNDRLGGKCIEFVKEIAPIDIGHPHIDGVTTR
jgi:hypothetical protein